jgi:hypothetical protein
VLRSARARRIEPEGPLLHLLAGAAFLAQAAVIGLLLCAETGDHLRLLAAYVLLLLLGWAAGVTAGHLPKLLSLSIWVWWPPGPRPKQAEMYPRRLAQAESGLFASGVEVAAIGVLVGNGAVARAGAMFVLTAALTDFILGVTIWRRRSRAR